MRKTLLLITISVLLASCGGGQSRNDKMAMLDSVMQRAIDNKVDSVMDATNDSLNLGTVLSKTFLISTAPIGWTCDSIGRLKLKDSYEYNEAEKEVLMEMLAGEMGGTPSWGISLERFRKLETIIKAAGVSDRAVYYRKYSLYMLHAMNYNEVIALCIDYDLPNKRIIQMKLLK